MHKTVLVQGPQVEPLEVSEAKAHLNVSGTSKDTYIESLIITVRRQVETYLRRALITQQWKVYYNCWQNKMQIPFGRLQIVENESVVVKYRNLSGTLTTLTESDYYWVVNDEDPGYIVRKYDATFPELQYGRPDAIEIAFTAGYGATSSAIPEDIRHAMKLILTNYFEQRGDIAIGSGVTVNKIPNFITDLLHPYKLYGF